MVVGRQAKASRGYRGSRSRHGGEHPKTHQAGWVWGVFPHAVPLHHDRSIAIARVGEAIARVGEAIAKIGSYNFGQKRGEVVTASGTSRLSGGAYVLNDPKNYGRTKSRLPTARRLAWASGRTTRTTR